MKSIYRGLLTCVTGKWQFPGGHLEFGEDIVACAERETQEETALVVKGTGIIAVTNDVFETDNKHYITLFVRCVMTNPDAVPQVRLSGIRGAEHRLFFFHFQLPIGWIVM